MKIKKNKWADLAENFLISVCTSDGASSVPGGTTTLYGTCYAWLALYYLGKDHYLSKEVFCKFVSSYQDSETGLFEGPELREYEIIQGIMHDRHHLMLHQTCSAVLPLIQLLNIEPIYIKTAYKFCNSDFLIEWLNKIDWKNAWFEGNNILFVAQLMVYLREFENLSSANDALNLWFSWLDKFVDYATGLWGTNGYCSPMEAVYGGYHQLLVYYYENHPLPNAQGLVDTVLNLQHLDGGFNPNGNSGACEDVDSVDILVNCYKRINYRRVEIRHALRRCLKHILSTQNSDGGFPYNRNQPQSHMGIPATEAGPNVSCTFPTWFRIHTLALIAEVLPNEPTLKGISFRFNTALSMGWHQSPPEWVPMNDAVTFEERKISFILKAHRVISVISRFVKKLKRIISILI